MQPKLRVALAVLWIALCRGDAPAQPTHPASGREIAPGIGMGGAGSWHIGSGAARGRLSRVLKTAGDAGEAARSAQTFGPADSARIPERGSVRADPAGAQDDGRRGAGGD